MNLLSIIHYPVFGGPHNQVLRLHRPLARRGWRTVALLPDEPGSGIERLRADGVDVVTAPLNRPHITLNPLEQARYLAGWYGEVRALRRLIRERQIDLVQMHTLAGPVPGIAARLEGIPLVWQLVDSRFPRMYLHAIMPVIRACSDALMSTGVGVARIHPGATTFGNRLVPFFPPVDTAAFRPDAARRAAARVALGVPADALLVGTVANLNSSKGHEYLIRALPAVQRTHTNVYARILGAHTATHATYEASIRAEAQAAGLMEGGRLDFIDPGDRVAELLPAFDLFVLTSVPRSEGVPTAILEAMACGLPVVATDVGGVREVVEDGVTGFVAPPLNPGAVAGAITRILGDADLRRAMGDVARRRAVQRYDVEVCADTHVHAYKQALAHHNRRRSPRAAARTEATTGR